LSSVFVRFSDNLVANFVLPTHFQYSPVASCLRRQQFSGVIYLYYPCFSSIKHTRKTLETKTLILVLTVNSLLLHNVVNIAIL